MDSPRLLTQRIYEMLMESQYWPPEQMLAFQRSQLEQLLRHAKATVPFYRSRLDAVFKKNGEIDWDRWNEIPIVTRADLRDKHDEMLTTALPPGHGPTKSSYSSGSSGVPIVIESTRVWTAANRAAGQRFYGHQHMDPAKLRATFSSKNAEGGPLREEFYVERWNSPSAGAKQHAQSIVLNRNLEENRKLDLLASEGAAYLLDVTNNVEILARANLMRNDPVGLEIILGYGQGLTADQRDLFHQSFGARSLSIYSSQEGGQMGAQCGDSFHYHLNPEIVLVEILHAEGRPCQIGEQGRIVVTPFFSTALPLIRYEQEDSAEFMQPCACGSELPVIGNITGRQDQFMRFPEGIRSATGLDQKLMRSCLNALVFQIAQVETFKLELRYVPARVGKQGNTDNIATHIRELIHQIGRAHV